MASYKSVQQTNMDASPRVMLRPNEMGGRVRVAYWEYTTVAAGLVHDADTLALVTLPKGARILGGMYVTEDMGASSEAVDIGIVGTVAKYASNALVDTAGAFAFANTIALNFGELLTAETTIIASPETDDWAAAAKFYGYILYAVD
jgi:hypothetical protein